jgi:hypothetical protein
MSRLTNEQLAFAIADSLREKGLIYSSKTFEASELISSKLRNYRNEVEPKQEKPHRGPTECGFPSDDALALQQLASGSANLDFVYTYQFVQNEQQNPQGNANLLGKRTDFRYQIEHLPMLQGTMTGTVYKLDYAVQTFVVSEAGDFTFTDIGVPENRVVKGSLDCNTGELQLKWASNITADIQHVVVSYEYNMECNV